MNKGAFWKTDWFQALVITMVVGVFSRVSDLIPSLERKAYDLGVKATSKNPSDKIAVIAIDDQSIANIGRWPWSREVLAKLTDKLAEAKAKVIGNTVFFFEPQLDPGLQYINRLLEIYSRNQAATGQDPAVLPANPDLAQFGTILTEAEKNLNADLRLAESFKKAGTVMLPIAFELGEARGKPDKPLPEFVSKHTIAGNDPDAAYPSAVAAIGHLNAAPDTDAAKVTDFGIARVTDSSKTKTGMVLGTPSYMSPEQLAGKKIDGRSDLFFLGVTLYKMACGRLPFEGESLTQLMYHIANDPHPDILGYNSALRPWMKDLIDRILAKNLDERFQTGAEFAAAIRTFQQAS